ncbi:hypothetical protein [Weissella minor]|uniref:Uncharacterized protein n=1 Tax=Weissella minor TaxID=1620 RepID=A0A0R2JI32_9LACO|nr:hypothetical protein [Weissella minor]KRN76985.1 hypothetical protein IV67_GL000498 [Weissella minor]
MTNKHQNIEKYLQAKGMPMTTEKQVVGDNEMYYHSGELVYSLRIKKTFSSVASQYVFKEFFERFTSYKHIDFYLPGKVKPYKRTLLNNKEVPLMERYYEQGTWTRLYDVYIKPDFSLDHTIMYKFHGKKADINWDDPKFKV